MKKRNYGVLTLILGLMLYHTALADSPWRDGKTFTVTVTNITGGQIFSPPVVVVHNRHFRLFELGEKAEAPLYSLAEDGLTDPLTNYVDGLDSVYSHAVSSGPVLPGESVEIDIETRGRYQFVSVAGMLVSTNDAFFAVRGLPVNRHRKNQTMAKAYDAGSETNSEDCTSIPGPPCGNGDVRDTAEAEGFIYIHSGIHGIADIEPAEFDWHNPVARITVTPKY